MSNIESVKGHLIVSCQALPDEPLHSSFIMGRMARAAKWGGAKGIRANTVEDINEIQKEVDLPVIGIGGINLNNLEQVLNAGACGVAIISAIAAKEDIAIEALAFKQRIMKILKGDELK